jgi:hypothetical protein
MRQTSGTTSSRISVWLTYAEEIQQAGIEAVARGEDIEPSEPCAFHAYEGPHWLRPACTCSPVALLRREWHYARSQARALGAAPVSVHPANAVADAVEALLAPEIKASVRRETSEMVLLLESGSVRDIVRTESSTTWCTLGKRMSMSHRERGIVQNGYFRCRGARCPHCVTYWLTRVVARAFEMWGSDAVLYRSEFETDAEWRNRARARRLTKTYPRTCGCG